MARMVTIALTDGSLLSPFKVDFPYWMEMRGVVAGAREHHGLDLHILRILSTEPGLTSGGDVTYLAEPADAAPVAEPDHPLRPDYARSGGPARTLAWAREALGQPIVAAKMQRTWNLSAIWELTTPDGPVWLKQVPRFFAHEPAVLRYLGRPRLIAADDEHGRMLLEHIPGGDLYDADFSTVLAIAEDMVRIQLAAIPRLAQLRAIGVPGMHELPARPWLGERQSRVDACGLPETLVHGDLHSGNVTGIGPDRTIIDWGDSFLGHPGFDILRLAERCPPEESGKLIAQWAALWRSAYPGSDPESAVEALRPIAALRMAATYAAFLANIEPTEHPYHVADVPACLAEADELAAA